MSTPLMEQYLEIKSRHQDCILLYRMGDFYELFHDDAVVASKVLGLTLTARNSGSEKKTPLAGFPYHSIEKHLPKLIRAGHKVAICEQIEDPAQAKGIVKRDVIEIITKGTAINENYLDEKTNNYLASIFPRREKFGLSYLDLSTGQFVVMEGGESDVIEELQRLNVEEVLFPSHCEVPPLLEEIQSQEKMVLTRLDKSFFHFENNVEVLLKHFKVHSLEVFDCESYTCGLQAAGANLRYVQYNKKMELLHLIRLDTKRFNEQMILDSASIRNLEIIKPLHADDETGTLFHLMDKTVTSMGGRLFKYWLTHPLVQIEKIKERQQAIGELIKNQEILAELQGELKEINDLERIVAKIGSRRANARDLLGMGRSLDKASRINSILKKLSASLFSEAEKSLAPLGSMGADLMDQFTENPPLTIREGKMLNPNKHPQLKEILDDAMKGKDWINNLEKNLKKETDISSAKIGFNKIFGYYIEITKLHSHKVPEHFIRKQTLVNAERYITPEMKEWEGKILNAEGKAHSMEYELFTNLRHDLAQKTPLLLEVSRLLATVDILCSLAQVSIDLNFTLPRLSEDEKIHILNGRHPVVESITEEGQYIANDAHLETKKRQILLITGPNMAGKSTYLRQIGLITLLAQVGSYVPAEEAHIGIVDRIFTRVGASDRLARGQSTFMVEMIETATILNNASPKSLILLDEIGRGTSTFDGLSLAWAIVEDLHENSKIAARTLFATHYHELTELPKKLKRVVNVQVAVKEVDHKVIFLRKILEGHCDSSYGIQVAAMAGIPQPIIDRAWEVLRTLEKEKATPQHKIGYKPRSTHKDNIPKEQQNLFSMAPTPPANPNHQLLHDALLRLDLNNLSPMQAFDQLHKLQMEFKISEK